MPKRKEEKVFKSMFPNYSNQELRDFESELETYREKKVDKKGEYSSINFWKYLQTKKAVTKDNAVIIGDSFPILYEVLNDKWNQLMKLKSRTEYAKEKKHERYEDLIQEVDLKNW